jgi:hypothetical protein
MKVSNVFAGPMLDFKILVLLARMPISSLSIFGNISIQEEVKRLDLHCALSRCM